MARKGAASFEAIVMPVSITSAVSEEDAAADGDKDEQSKTHPFDIGHFRLLP